MSKLKSYQSQVQEAIEKGIKTLEEQHLALSAKPFEYAMKIEKEAKSYSVANLRDLHDQTIDSVYESMLKLNRKVNELAADLIAKIEGEEKPAAEKAAAAAAKKARGAAKKAAKSVAEAAEKVEEAVS